MDESDQLPAAEQLFVLLAWLHAIEVSHRDGTRPAENILTMLRGRNFDESLSVVHAFFENARNTLTADSGPAASSSSSASSSSASAAAPAAPVEHVASSSSSSSSSSNAAAAAAATHPSTAMVWLQPPIPAPPPPAVLPPPPPYPVPQPQRLFIDHDHVAHVVESCPAASPLRGAKRRVCMLYSNNTQYFQILHRVSAST